MPWAGQSPVKPLPVKRPDRLAANSVADWKSRSTRRLPLGAHSKLTQTFAKRLRNTSEPPLVNSVVSGEDASSMPRSRTAEVRRKRRLLSSPRPVYRAIRTPRTEKKMGRILHTCGEVNQKKRGDGRYATTGRWLPGSLIAEPISLSGGPVGAACPGLWPSLPAGGRPPGAPDLQPERRQPLLEALDFDRPPQYSISDIAVRKARNSREPAGRREAQAGQRSDGVDLQLRWCAIGESPVKRPVAARARVEG